MDLTPNGHPVSLEIRDGASLLELLREVCGLTSVKDGCAPEGSCGACTVLVDGKAVVSCAQPAARAAGRSIVTQEGLGSEERKRWADCCVASAASKCWFCSPASRGPGCCRSTRRRPKGIPASSGWSRRRTCPASGGRA